VGDPASFIADGSSLDQEPPIASIGGSEPVLPPERLSGSHGFPETRGRRSPFARMDHLHPREFGCFLDLSTRVLQPPLVVPGGRAARVGAPEQVRYEVCD